MSRLIFCLVCLASLSVAAAATAEEKWQDLLADNDLSQWKAIDGDINSWSLEDGVLACTGDGAGWLSTNKEYGDFELKMEFRVPAGGNSGVFLRAPHEGNPAFAGMEIQVLDDTAPEYANLQPYQYTASLYDVLAAKPRASKAPGEWQTMDIQCHDRHLKITLNGQVVIDTQLDDHYDRLDTHPGLKRAAGHLGFQNHGSRIEYRNVKLREL